MGHFAVTRPHEYVLSFPDDDYIGQRILATGRPYEPHLLRAVAALGKQHTVIDVGANVGNHSTYWGAAGIDVVAYEPNPVAIGWLRGNIEANRLQEHVRIRPVAVGATTAEAEVVSTPDGNLGGVMVRPTSGGPLAMVRLDDENLRHVAVLKIDVEGAELEVLIGATDLLNQQHPIVIMETFNLPARRRLEELGFVRLPLPLAQATHLYAFGRTRLLRAVTSPEVARSLIGSFVAHARGASRVRLRKLRDKSRALR